MQDVTCPNRNDSSLTHHLTVCGTKEDIFLGSGKSAKLEASMYTIDIVPRLVLKNCLPVTLHYTTR